jgi:RNA polymerase sigma-70 factor (ECF subfamily)
LAVLVGRAQSGHLPSLDRLLQQVQGSLYGHTLTLTSDATLSEDVLQSALWTIARKIGQLRDPALFRAWAYRIASRLAIRARRQGRLWHLARSEESLALLPDEADDRPAEARLNAEEAERIVGQVSGVVGVALRLFYIDGFSYLEIAEALDIPVGTVKSRIAYALAGLRRQQTSRL